MCVCVVMYEGMKIFGNFFLNGLVFGCFLFIS